MIHGNKAGVVFKVLVSHGNNFRFWVFDFGLVPQSSYFPPTSKHSLKKEIQIKTTHSPFSILHFPFPIHHSPFPSPLLQHIQHPVHLPHKRRRSPAVIIHEEGEDIFLSVFSFVVTTESLYIADGTAFHGHAVVFGEGL